MFNPLWAHKTAEQRTTITAHSSTASGTLAVDE